MHISDVNVVQKLRECFFSPFFFIYLSVQRMSKHIYDNISLRYDIAFHFGRLAERESDTMRETEKERDGERERPRPQCGHTVTDYIPRHAAVHA